MNKARLAFRIVGSVNLFYCALLIAVAVVERGLLHALPFGVGFTAHLALSLASFACAEQV